MSDSLISLLTAYGDDELILGHRHSEWTGFAPHIEEDVAFSSIAQDEIGHSAAYYEMVAKLAGGDADGIALGRDRTQYRHAIICERGNGEWAYTLARHWIYDVADEIRLEVLEGSAQRELAALATKMRREERYHLIHADAWMKRVARGPVEGRTRLEEGVSKAFTEAIGLFEPIDLEDDAVKEGWLPAPSSEMQARFVARITEAIDDLGLPTEVKAPLDESAEFVASSSGDLIVTGDGDASRPEVPSGMGGRRGRHSNDFDELWDDMTRTYRENPGATW